MRTVNRRSLSSMGCSGKKWIGVDTEVCADAGGTAVCAVSQLAHVRPGGARVAMSIPMDSVFFEKIELPNMGRAAAEKLVIGKFDLKLPVPIEKCIVYVRPVRSSRGPLFLAFAVTRDAYKAHLSAFRAATGCDPEAVFPSADAMADACVRHLGGATPSALLLHSALGKWTLIAIENGVLSGVVTLAAGDTAAAMRNAKILCMRFQTQPMRFLVSGTGAEELAKALAEAPNAMECPLEALPATTNFLAAALARRGALKESEGGFRQGDLRHPAHNRRIMLNCLALGFITFALSASALGLVAVRHARSARALSGWNAFLDGAAARVANCHLTQHGRAAVEVSKGLFDWRNPAVAARAETSPMAAIPALFDAASTRGLTFSSIDYDGKSLAISGNGAVEADMEVLRQAAARAGFALEARVAARGDGIGFTATVTPKGGEP